MQSEVSAMARLARGLPGEKPDPAGLRERIGRNLEGWSQRGQLFAIRRHLASAQRRRKAAMVADIS